jgi:hypothetical protein
LWYASRCFEALPGCAGDEAHQLAVHAAGKLSQAAHHTVGLVSDPQHSLAKPISARIAKQNGRSRRCRRCRGFRRRFAHESGSPEALSQLQEETNEALKGIGSRSHDGGRLPCVFVGGKRQYRKAARRRGLECNRRGRPCCGVG